MNLGLPLSRIFMKSSGGKVKAPTTLRLIVLVVFALGMTAVLRPTNSAAHIPITTKIMFDKEVIRILQRNCIACHRPGGAAFSLASYTDARPWAKAIEVEILEGRMPPWRPVKGFGDFANSPALTQQDTDLIVNWVENGVPEGDPKDLPKPPMFSDSWKLGDPDLILNTGQSPAVKSGADEYATFTLSTGLKEDRWIGAMDLRPGNASIVRSATIYLRRSGEAGAEKKSGQLEELATWVPGQVPFSAHNAGWLLPVGSQLVVKMHYRGSDEQSDQPGTDVSQLGIYLMKKPPRNELVSAAVACSAGCPDETIPVTTSPRRVEAEYTLPQTEDVVAVHPAVNPLIVSVQATAYKPDGGQQILLWSTGYGLGWAQDYYLRRPEKLAKGTRIEVTAYFDNSDNNRNNPNRPAAQVKWTDAGLGPLCSFLMARPESSPY